MYRISYRSTVGAFSSDGLTSALLACVLQNAKTRIAQSLLEPEAFRATVGEQFLWTALSRYNKQNVQAQEMHHAAQQSITASPTSSAKRLRGHQASQTKQSKADVYGSTPSPTPSPTPIPTSAEGVYDNLETPAPTPMSSNGWEDLSGLTGEDWWAHSNVTLSDRGNRWVDYLAPVLNGSFTCPFDRLLLSAQLPYLRISRLHLLLTELGDDVARAQACFFTLLAFLAADPAVLFLETYPLIQTFNQVASALAQTATKTSTPYYDVGLNGTNQVGLPHS